ncbi:MAG TPA: hypothetical protein VM121_09610 [Acidimicrobiales bacterium]|nr:hypothetical protein [Acidimicrobiales bacterium]
MRTDLVTRAQDLWAGGRSWTEILDELRRAGASKIDCVRAAVQILRVPTADAKMLVHYSDVWADVRGADEQFHESLIAAAESVSDVSSAPSPGSV